MFDSGDRELPTAKIWQIQVDQQFLGKSGKILVWGCFLYLQMETFALFFQGQVGMDEHLYGKKIKLLK